VDEPPCCHISNPKEIEPQVPPPAEGVASRLILGPTLRTQPDRRLVTLVREGYEVAFDEIVRRYGRPLTRYAASIVGGRSEDVAQDAFSKALLALRRDDAEIDLRPWLFRIVRNTALNDLRDSPPSPEALAEAIAGGRDPAEELERREELTDLIRRLQALPEPQRAAIVMRELEGLSHVEIAAALGLSGGGARQAIHRARQTLRDGAGMLLPLPLLRTLLEHGPDVAAAGTGGATVAAGSAVSGAGAGVALKAGLVTAVLAGSLGTGIALHENRGGAGIADAAAATAARETTSGRQAPVPAAPESSTAIAVESATEMGHGGNGGPDEHGGSGESHRDDVSAHGAEEGQGSERHGGGGPGRGGPAHEDSSARGPGPGRHGGHGEDGGSERGRHDDGGELVELGHSGPSRHEDRLGRGPGDEGHSEGSDGEGHGEGGSGSTPPLPPPPPAEEGQSSGHDSERDGSGEGGGDRESP
jgi:RNA polymerase sigma factor (sigma-70 family)